MIAKLIAATVDPLTVCGLAATVCRTPEKVRHFVEFCPHQNANFIESKQFNAVLNQCRKSGHMSVFEHVSYTFLIDGISRACSHQLVRHRLASFTQASQRHAEAEKVVLLPDLNAMQGEIWAKAVKNAFDCYRELIMQGVPLEDARSVLPNAASTTIIMTMNARELAHFLELRLCNKAQREIRELAQEIHKLVKEHFPLLFEHVGPPCTQSGCKERIPCEAARAGDRELFEDKFRKIHPEK